MKPVRWGVVGPGYIANKFATAIADVSNAELVAIASHSKDRLNAFADRYGVSTEFRFNDYESLMQCDQVDAIYIANLNTAHASTALLAMRSGKHVLVEKPAAMTAAEVQTLTEVAEQEQRLFMEAVMYLCHPQMLRVEQIIRSGELGQLMHIEASFGFSATPDKTSRLFSHDHGGGGILDVGCYPVSFARRIAGINQQAAFSEPRTVVGVGTLYETGIDTYAHALLQFDDNLTASCSCAITRNLENTATIYAEHGSLCVLTPWLPGDGNKPSDATIRVTINGKERIESIASAAHHYSYEIEHASTSIQASQCEAVAPAMTHAGSVGNATVLDQWRQQIAYEVAQDQPKTNKRLTHLLPVNIEPMRYAKLDGIEQPLSRLILGCDNRNTLADGCVVWDAWMEAGGTAFDTAHIYANGLNEIVFGQWIKSRGVQNDIVTVVKGAHSPYCLPAAIETQLDESLGRLGLDKAKIYIMHRDNLQVPVGEFVSAINTLIDQGRVDIYGGSNWGLERFQQAREFAMQNNLVPPSIVNNNCSLATMEKPVWDGCISANNAHDLAWFEKHQVAHLAWSAQARGYFMPEHLRERLPAGIGPEECFGSTENEERRHRAGVIADEMGVSTSAVALAWVLSLPFPSFALVGPRSVGEIASLMPALSVSLTPKEVAWLNLTVKTR